LSLVSLWFRNKMVILIEEVEWQESDKAVTINLQMKGVKADNLDIVQTDNYIKVGLDFYFIHLQM
jgi:hypothetical protein